MSIPVYSPTPPEFRDASDDFQDAWMYGARDECLKILDEGYQFFLMGFTVYNEFPVLYDFVRDFAEKFCNKEEKNWNNMTDRERFVAWHTLNWYRQEYKPDGKDNKTIENIASYFQDEFARTVIVCQVDRLENRRVLEVFAMTYLKALAMAAQEVWDEKGEGFVDFDYPALLSRTREIMVDQTNSYRALLESTGDPVIASSFFIPEDKVEGETSLWG